MHIRWKAGLTALLEKQRPTNAQPFAFKFMGRQIQFVDNNGATQSAPTQGMAPVTDAWAARIDAVVACTGLPIVIRIIRAWDRPDNTWASFPLHSVSVPKTLAHLNRVVDAYATRLADVPGGRLASSLDRMGNMMGTERLMRFASCNRFQVSTPNPKPLLGSLFRSPI